MTVVRAVMLGVVAVALFACDEASQSPDAGRASDAGTCLALPDVIDFGETPVDVGVERTVLLTNSSPTESAELTTQISGAPFATSLPPRQFLGPRQSMLVVVRFNAPDGRLHLGTLTFTGGVGCPTQNIELRGLGAGSLKSETPFLDFGFAPLGVEHTRIIRLINTRRSEVRLTVTVPPPFRVSGPLVVPALGALEVPVSVTPLAGDVLAGRIFIIGSHATVNGTPIIGDSLDLEVRGHAGQPRIVVERTSVVLDHIPVNGVLSRTIGIRNDGDSETSLSVVFEDGDGGSPVQGIAPAATFLAAHSRGEVMLELRAPFAGSLSALVSVHDAQTDAGATIIDVSGTGEIRTGCPQQLEVFPQSVMVSPPYPATVTFTFSNPTSTVCLVDDVRGSLPGWSLASGERDQILVPAHGTAMRTLIIDGPGNGALLWTTFTTQFVSPNQSTSVSAAP